MGGRDAEPINCRRTGLLYETSCKSCVDEEGKSTAKYVGESARSGMERYGEHVDGAATEKSDSHMYKHWQTVHRGARTEFEFRILGFFSSALERQVAEAVRIRRTGATKILNSKSEYSRCKIPRLIAEDTEVETNLGDMVEELEDEVFWEMEEEKTNPKEMRRKARKERLKDLLNWGQEEESLTREELDTVEALIGMLENKQADEMVYEMLGEVVDDVVREGQGTEMVRRLLEEVTQKKELAKRQNLKN